MLIGTLSGLIYQMADFATQYRPYWIAVVALATGLLPSLIKELSDGEATATHAAPGVPQIGQVAAREQQADLEGLLDETGTRWPRVRSMAWRVRQRVWRRSRVPEQLPERLKEFRGRATDLAALLHEYRTQSDRHSDSPREDQARTGSILLAVHGMPGIGKSELASEFAHRHAKEFPDGQLYANLGIAGAERDPGQILDGFLDALGRLPKERPTDSAARSKLFRTLTRNRRILIVLDAARNADQVRQLLPTDPRCLVIVTSRRDLGPALGAKSWELRPLDPPDAVELFTAYAQTTTERGATDAAKVAELCGSVPLALRSAGEQVAFEEDLGVPGLVRWLEPAYSRLDRLQYRGRDIEERITAEYLRLGALHQAAFRKLALVSSPTFLAWTLVPLLSAAQDASQGAPASPAIGLDEAEAVAAHLAAVQLLTVVGPAGELRTARYALNPLVRLVAAKLLASVEAEADQRAAAVRLDAAYFFLATRILHQREPGAEGLREWLLDPEWQLIAPMADRISVGGLDQWVRAEYLSLLHCVEFAGEHRAWSPCWRIAAQLGSCVPDGLDHEAALNAFQLAEHAAVSDRQPRGQIRVLLARGSFLAAVERYGEAVDAIERAQDLAAGWVDTLGEAGSLGLRAACKRKLGEAWLQLAAYERADYELAIADGLAKEARDTWEEARIRLLRTDADSRIKAERYRDRQEYDDALANNPDDETWFRAHLGRSESKRRNGEWDGAIGDLRDALTRNHGDTRRRAAILYRSARVKLCQNTHISGPHNGVLNDAIGYANAALLTFETMRNESGVIRALALLAEALIEEGCLAEARELIDRAEQTLNSLRSTGDTLEPLTARVQRSRGSLHLAAARWADACGCLSEAVEIFERNGDWRSLADTRVLLGKAQALLGEKERDPRRRDEARAALGKARQVYLLSNDGPAVQAVDALIRSLQL
jgi:tetratricopeptide (TPR) repeat protein